MNTYLYRTYKHKPSKYSSRESEGSTLFLNLFLRYCTFVNVGLLASSILFCVLLFQASQIFSSDASGIIASSLSETPESDDDLIFAGTNDNNTTTTHESWKKHSSRSLSSGKTLHSTMTTLQDTSSSEYVLSPAELSSPTAIAMSVMSSSTVLNSTASSILIIGSCVLGVVFAAMLWLMVSTVKVRGSAPYTYKRMDRGNYSDNEMEDGLGMVGNGSGVDEVDKAAEIQDAIEVGATSFLQTEYRYMAIFVACFSVFLFIFLSSVSGLSHNSTSNSDNTTSESIMMSGGETSSSSNVLRALLSCVAFMNGAATSALCGYVGMKIATFSNARTALEARKSVCAAFVIAFRSGAVMGFFLTSLGLFTLWLTIVLYRVILATHGGEEKFFHQELYECIASYGLGGSAIALFGRVGGGIYTKAADVGADLVGKVENNIPEDDPRNPATIADNVGDNVGDIAGMGADLFGSFGEATCAALVVASSASSLGQNDSSSSALDYPLLLSAIGICTCFVTTVLCTEVFPPKSIADIEKSLKRNLIVSTVIMTPAVFMLSSIALPSTFTITDTLGGNGSSSTSSVREIHSYNVSIAVCMGLWAGLLIGLVTEYYTSNTYKPVIELAHSCRTGAATNIIFGLALGYKSCIIPVFAIAISAYLSFALAGFFGVACAALGMLGTLASGLAIDAYGPISDNAGGIAEMSGMGEEVRMRTDALDAAGNTTAAIGKGFAIGSAALVSLALFGAYITRAGIDPSEASILDAKVFFGLLIGSMLPYWFSAQTMKSVGKAALAMVIEVRRQFKDNPGIIEGTVRPDYAKCVAISTDASLAEMIAPACLVLLAPIVFGICFGTRTLAGLLAGGLVSGVQMAISSSNTGGAWDNAKKYIEAARSVDARELGGKGSEAHKAAVVGDTVGDPLKDTSGPALNILMKLMAVESLVLAPFFANVTPDGIVFSFLDRTF